MLSNNELEKIHKLSIGNKEYVQASEKCGCFHCLQIFDSSKIKNYIADKPTPTATCPYCQVDSILCDANIQLSIELLKDMSNYYFK